jgi:uncharacterized protein (DUF1330 family)
MTSALRRGVFFVSDGASRFFRMRGTSTCSDNEVNDQDNYMKVVAPVAEKTTAEAGGRFLARGKPVSLSGEPPRGRLVIVQFENMDQLQKWWNNPEWQAAHNGAPAAHKEFGFHVKMDRTSGGRLPKAKSDAAIVSEAPEESSRTAKPPLHHFNDKADVCARGDIRDKYRDNLRSIRADCCRL